MAMKMINTKVHGALDYIVGVLLIASPWLLGYSRGGTETWVPVTFGIITLVYSLLTNYEAGLIRMIPMPAHLLLDTMSGLLLAISPWLFDFNAVVFLPHLVIGVAGLGLVIKSSSRPFASRRNKPFRMNRTHYTAN